MATGLGTDPKMMACAQKIGTIIANRYPTVIDEHMAGWLTADDPETFRERAQVAIREELWRMLHEAMGAAIDARQQAQG